MNGLCTESIYELMLERSDAGKIYTSLVLKQWTPL